MAVTHVIQIVIIWSTEAVCETDENLKEEDDVSRVVMPSGRTVVIWISAPLVAVFRSCLWLRPMLSKL